MHATTAAQRTILVATAATCYLCDYCTLYDAAQLRNRAALHSVQRLHHYVVAAVVG